MPALVVIFGRDRGRFFNLEPGKKLVIGRSRHMPNHLNDPSISRRHLEIAQDEADPDTWTVADLESRNGARINQHMLLMSKPLADGDIIQLGYTLLVFVRVTFGVDCPVYDFLEDCEHIYEKDIMRLRDRASRHEEKEDPGYASAGGMSGTLHLSGLLNKLKGH